MISDDYFLVEEADIRRIETVLAMVGTQSSTPMPRLGDLTAHGLPSRRHDGAAAYPAVAEHTPGRVEIHMAAAVDENGEPEMAYGTANVGLIYAGLGHLLPRCPSVNCTGRDSERPSTS